jgi:hypothetical protein
MVGSLPAFLLCKGITFLYAAALSDVIIQKSSIEDTRYFPPSMWRYPQGALQQGTLAGDVCLALASTGRTAALFDFGAPWRRLFDLRHRRPFSSSSTVQGVYLTPSGKIPGGKDDGLWSSFGIGGDQGLDCVFLSFFRAPCAYVQDSFVISIFLRVLLVIWSVTVWN